MRNIYLDNAATSPVFPEVIDSISKSLQSDYGNPSSLHRLGIQSEKKIRRAGQLISNTLGIESGQIIFTSGGTEANNMAIIGAALARQRQGRHLITTLIEHPSVLRTFEFLEEQVFEVTYLPVDERGLVCLDRLKEAIRKDTILVSIMHVNNEIGSIQPIREIGQAIKAINRDIVFHVDAVQSFGRLDLSPRDCQIDLLTASGHKIHGPKGIGFLYKKADIRLRPIIFGGGQQDDLRSGTENLSGIVGLEKAVEMINQKKKECPNKLYNLKDLLLTQIKKELAQAVFPVDPTLTAPHIISIAFPGLLGEVILHALEEENVYVGTGSACSGRRRQQSHVLKAVGLDSRAIEAAIRVSTSYMTSQEDIKDFVTILKNVVKRLERFSRR